VESYCWIRRRRRRRRRRAWWGAPAPTRILVCSLSRRVVDARALFCPRAFFLLLLLNPSFTFDEAATCGSGQGEAGRGGRRGGLEPLPLLLL